MSRLHDAVHKGDLALIARLLEGSGKGWWPFGRVDVNAPNGNGWTPLHCARTPEVTRLLIENGARVNAPGKSGMTPLHGAAFANQPEVVKVLLMHGADVDLKDENGLTPLRSAGKHYHYDCMELLIKHGASVDPEIDAFLLKSMMRHAVENKHADVAKLLVERGLDVNCSLGSGETLLHVAACSGKQSIVKLLVEHGADVNARDRDGKTPLDCTWSSDVGRILKAAGGMTNRAQAEHSEQASGMAKVSTPRTPAASGRPEDAVMFVVTKEPGDKAVLVPCESDTVPLDMVMRLVDGQLGLGEIVINGSVYRVYGNDFGAMMCPLCISPPGAAPIYGPIVICHMSNTEARPMTKAIAESVAVALDSWG